MSRPAKSHEGRRERFAAALTANAGSTHGPFAWDAAGAAVVALSLERAGGLAVAVATGDPVVGRLGVVERLREAGAELLLPDDPAWAQRLPEAGVGVTGAALGVAATGTVAVACGMGSPRGTSLVPPAHVCLVRASEMVEDLAEALARLPSLPSALAWISGPSRSADLEMTLTLGVHGPGAVDVVLIDDGS